MVKWAYQFAELTKGTTRSSDSPPFATPANGPVWALLSLCYDLFCLQTKNELPDLIVERLRRSSTYQGARYEVGVAAIMMRSGFNVRFLEDSERTEKHCEFIAMHRSRGIQIGVEAKSRRRAGAVNEPGEFSYTEDARGLENLVRQAKKQGPEGLPFLIFVDLNLPASPGLRTEDRPWMRDVKKLLERLGAPSADSPDPFNALVLTNYSFYYGAADSRVPNPEWGMAITNYPVRPLDLRLLAEVEETLSRYGVIPTEV